MHDRDGHLLLLTTGPRGEEEVEAELPKRDFPLSVCECVKSSPEQKQKQKSSDCPQRRRPHIQGTKAKEPRLRKQKSKMWQRVWESGGLRGGTCLRFFHKQPS